MGSGDQRLRALGETERGEMNNSATITASEGGRNGGIIRPLGIAEIGRAAGEGVRAHRRPDGIGQIRAGFHHDDHVAGPVDGEPKPIRQHAKAGTAGLHLRVPQHGRKTGIGGEGTPARGPRQVIDGRIGVTGEHRRIATGGVALEIDSRQAGALENASVPMLVTLLGIVTLVRLAG